MIAVIILLLVVSIGSLVYLVATAPEGYEDERGFHRVEK